MKLANHPRSLYEELLHELRAGRKPKTIDAAVEAVLKRVRKQIWRGTGTEESKQALCKEVATDLRQLKSALKHQLSVGPHHLDR